MNITDFYALYLQANKVTIDSRKIEKNDIFFAFSGDNFNAATLAETAMDNGALAVIVEDENFDVAKLKIVVDGRTYNLEVAKHEKILDVILDKGIDVRHSCKGGLCTQCVAKINHGKVEMLQNIGLSGEEIQQGLVLTCQGVPLTSEIFLNFDFEW